MLTLLEDGGSGFWHRITVNYSVNNFGIGIMSEEFTGIGPRIEFNIPNTPVQLWTSMLSKNGDTNIYMVFKLIF